MPIRSLGVLLCLLWPTMAAAQPASLEGRWTVSFGAGIDGLSGGTVHDAGTGQALGFPVTVERRAFTELYDHGWRFTFGAGYGLAEGLEIIGQVSVGGVNGQEEPVGEVGDLPLRARFDDYRDVAFEGGLRIHFDSGRRLRPHINAVGGIRRVDAISATFSVPDVDVTLPDTPFYDTSTVFSFGADGGLAYWVSERTAIGGEIGFRYQTGLSDVDEVIGQLGLAAINDNGDRWSIPVSAIVRIVF